MPTIITSLFLVILSTGPAILLMKIIGKNQALKDNKKITRKLFLLSILMVIPILVAELDMEYFNPYNLNSLHYFIFDNFIGIAIIEEGFKWLLMYCFVTEVKTKCSKYDYVVWAVAASLGFALIENVAYVFSADEPFTVAILRMFLSVPSHMCYAILMGHFFGSHKEAAADGRIIRSLGYILLSIVVPTILHGNDNLLIDLRLYPLLIIQDIIVPVVCLRMWYKVMKNDYFKHELEKFISMLSANWFNPMIENN